MLAVNDDIGEASFEDPAIKSNALPLQVDEQIFKVTLCATRCRQNVKEVDACFYSTCNANDAGSCPECFNTRHKPLFEAIIAKISVQKCYWNFSSTRGELHVSWGM